MASTAVSEFSHRIPCAQAQQSHHRRSGNVIVSDTGKVNVEQMTEICPRSLSRSAISCESEDFGEECEEHKDGVTNTKSGVSTDSLVCAAHIINIDAEDGDDDVFDSTPEVETVQPKREPVVDSFEAQYDDLSSFSTTAHQEGDIQRQERSKCHLTISDDSSQNLNKEAIAHNLNTTATHNSIDSTTSAIVDICTTNFSCHDQQQNCIFFDPYPIVSESLATGGISLFEKLVRTHPIWYLPHIGRVAAVHLLRGKTPGVFIVRRSSQPNSMAISIKLPPGANQEIEHYLIETTIAGVHLEGSPNYFRELPFLLAYYCENGGELHTNLTLPKAILECESLRNLCSLSLLGPEFWTSNHCVEQAAIVDDDTTANHDHCPKRPHPSPPTRLKSELAVNDSVTKTSAGNSNPLSPIMGEIEMHHSSTGHRRSLSVSGYPVTMAKSNSSKPAVLQQGSGTFRKLAPFPNPEKQDGGDSFSSAPAVAPKKPQKEKTVLAKFRSDSVGAEDTQTDQKEQSERRSFRFRNLFDVARRPSVGSPPSPLASRHQQKSDPTHSSAKSRKAKHTLVESSKRNVDVTSKDHRETASNYSKGAVRQAVFYVHRRPAPLPPISSPPVYRPATKRTSPVSKTPPPPAKPKEEHEYYYFSPSTVQSPSLGAALNESRSVSSLLQEAATSEERQHVVQYTPTMRRRLLTFKPGSPTGSGDELTTAASSVETTLERPTNMKTASLHALPADSRLRSTHDQPRVQQARQQSVPPLEVPQPKSPSVVRTPLLRREKSDLGWLPIGKINRVCGIYATENPRQIQNHQRQAVLPPENKDETFKTCVEELRKRRLESLRQQMITNTNVLHSRRDGSAHVVPSRSSTSKQPLPTSRDTAVVSAFSQSPPPPPPSQDNVLRAKSARQQSCGAVGPLHRLSAPNLAECLPSSPGGTTTERQPVVELVRTRQQPKTTTSNTGTLHTINEGLVTPMARRRRGANSKRRADGAAERRLSQSLEDLPTASAIQDQKQFVPSAPTTPSVPAKQLSPEKSANSAASSSLRRRGSDNVTATSSTSFHSTMQQRNEKAFHSETHFQWVAVTNEIRHRQKVAKVTPTQSPRVHEARVGQSGAGTTKFSDYVMLNECAEMLSDIGGSSLGNQQDDEEYGSGRYGSIGGTAVRRQDSQVGNVCIGSFLSPCNPYQQQLQDGDVDDARSVVSTAGTVFNEPWDSSVWENLLTLASSMDKNGNGHIIPDSRSSFATNSSSAASSCRPSRVESSNAADLRAASSTAATPKDGADRQHRQQQQKTSCNRQAAFAWADRLKKLKENNIPPPLAPHWEEFSSCIPMSSDSSLPTSTPTNSLEGKRKSLLATAAEASYSQDSDLVGVRRDGTTNTTGNSGQDEGALQNENRFHLAPAACPLRFRNSDVESVRRRDRSRRRPVHDPASKIQECVEKLANDITTFFGAQVQYFIKCTTEGHETDPSIVLGNVRQFMNGLKNYLVKHGECDLHPVIEQERSKLRPTEFLNIDAILEGVLQKIVLAPLKPHLYRLLVKEGSSNGSLESLSENIAAIRNRPLQDFGITVDSRDSATMEPVRTCFRKMQHHYSPLKKLEYLLNAVALAYEHRQATPVSGQDRRSTTGQLPCADELLRWFVYLVSRCSMVLCEIESMYMWNLLHPALLAGEASYYLTAFSSAVHVLKHVDLLPKLNDSCSLSSQVGEGEGFIRVAVPDEINGAIKYHSFPIMPQLTVARLCRMIARKCGITNPEDYGLYLLVDGYETCLLSTECPELVKEHLRTSNKAHLFAYKRHEAKIAWPKVAMSPRL